MQRDAMDRLGLRQLLLEPEMLEAVAARRPPGRRRCVGLGRVIPERVARDGAGGRARRSPTSSRSGCVADDACRPSPARSTARPAPAARGAATSTGTARSRANLKHYQPEHRTIVPERLVGYARRRTAVERRHRPLHRPVRARWPSRSSTPASSARCSRRCGRSRRRLVVFDTAVVDLTDELDDPVDVLFGVQLGGGTDINQALALLPGAHRAARRHDPRADQRPLRGRHRRGDAAPGRGDRRLRRQMIALLALSDDGAPVLRRTSTPRRSPRSASRPSRARPTCSPTSWRPRSSSATSPRGPPPTTS